MPERGGKHWWGAKVGGCRLPEILRSRFWSSAQTPNWKAERKAFMTERVISGGLRTEPKNAKDPRGMNELEQDLFTLNAIAPALLEQVPALFEEAVKETLGSSLGLKESKGALSWFRDADLRSRPEVFSRLASHYGGGASPLQIMIDKAFKNRVHNFLDSLGCPSARTISQAY
jgi:hypothetical protein